MISFYEVALKATYNSIETKNIDGFYLIKETEEIFLGENPFGRGVKFFDTALPASGFVDKLYVVRDGTAKGLYYWDGSAFKDIVSASLVSIDGEQTLTNKTINADDNTITNIGISNFASNLLDTDLKTGTKTDNTIPTSKAVVDYLSDAVGGIFNLMGSVNIASPGTTFNNAKKGYTWNIEGSAVYQGVDFNTNDLIVFSKDITGAPQTGDFFKLDNTESPDIIRKIVGAGVNTIVTFTSDGGIQSSAITISTAEPVSTSTDATVPTSKSVFTAVNKKATKPTSPVNGNILKTDASGNLIDSGIAATNIATLNTSQTLTNKTINAANNTVSGLKLTNFDASVVKTSLTDTATDTEFLTAKAVYDALKIERL